MDATKLANRDYVLVIDKSGSMASEDCNGKSRWKAAQESTFAIATKLNELDPDGIDVVTFSDDFKVYNNTTPEKVKDVFSSCYPMGSTDLTKTLNYVFDYYLNKKKAGTTQANGMMCVVITDGQPDDESSVAKAIVNFTKKIDNREEFGLSLIQIGSDAHAAKYLARLDSHLTDEGAKLDIVNTKTFEEVSKVGLTETLIAALTE